MKARRYRTGAGRLYPRLPIAERRTEPQRRFTVAVRGGPLAPLLALLLQSAGQGALELLHQLPEGEVLTLTITRYSFRAVRQEGARFELSPESEATSNAANDLPAGVAWPVSCRLEAA